MSTQRSGYGQYCPISRAVEVLGERWSLLIIRDMLVGASRFNDLARGLPGLSRSLLVKRLRQLERAGPGLEKRVLSGRSIHGQAHLPVGSGRFRSKI